MEAMMNSSILPAPRLLNSRAPNGKHFKLCCLRKNGDLSGFSRNPFRAHDAAEISQPFMAESETVERNQVWKLFKEAQQNILRLNKQRLLAVEELDRANKEIELLREKMRKLEAEKQSSARTDNTSLCWELLLRIDSLVLTGMISTEESYDLRRLVMERKDSVADFLSDVHRKGDAELLAELRTFFIGSKKKGIHVIHICTEFESLISVGPLAPYVTGISRAMQKKGHLVEVIMPKYPHFDLENLQLREMEAEAYSYFNGQLHGNKIWTGVLNGLGVTLIEPLYYKSLFSRETIYGYADDFERFSYFSRASLDYVLKSGKQPDVLHIHNWETAIVGPLFWDIFAKQGLGGTRILFTCHSFDSQCLVPPDKLALCGLDPVRLNRPDRLQDNAKTHLVNILKGGIVYSNKVVIMSSLHSEGKIVHSLTHGLEPTLTIHKDKLLVSPYGFETSAWDPSMDKYLPETYSAHDIKGKAVCKATLQQHLGFPQDVSTILVGCIFSDVLDHHMENLTAAFSNATKAGCQIFFMGNCMTPRIKRAMGTLLEELHDEAVNVKVFYSYDEALSHLMFAGSDIMLCQSFNDPIIQVPLKALKYGAAPIELTSSDKSLRSPFRYAADHHHEVSRFSQFMRSKFGIMSLPQALDEIKRPSIWRQMITDAMAMDFSWDAECYDVHLSAYTSLRIREA